MILLAPHCQCAASSLPGEEEENAEPAAVAQSVIEDVMWCLAGRRILEVTSPGFPSRTPWPGPMSKFVSIRLGVCQIARHQFSLQVMV